VVENDRSRTTASWCPHKRRSGAYWELRSARSAVARRQGLRLCLRRSPVLLRLDLDGGGARLGPPGTPHRSEFHRSPMPAISAYGATRTYCNVRYPVVMGWQADLEEAVLNDLDL
jgi:hypothetical protein